MGRDAAHALVDRRLQLLQRRWSQRQGLVNDETTAHFYQVMADMAGTEGSLTSAVMGERVPM